MDSDKFIFMHSMHKYCTQIVEQFRRPECQKLHGYMHMKGAGRSNGEPHENLNAFLGPLGRISMYMSRYNRQVSQADCEGVNGRASLNKCRQAMAWVSVLSEMLGTA